MGFLKGREILTSWNSKSTGCFTLSGFWKGFEKFDFSSLCYQTNSIECFENSTDFFMKTLTKLC